MQTVLDKALSAFPRADLLPGSTPVQRASRLEQHLGLHKQEVKLFIKRDDHMLIGGGGNKLRKLEFHLGAALQDGVDTLITVGGIQSNHARLTAAVCARLGLGCELILSRAVAKSDADYELNGNMLLDHLFGARVHVLGQGEDSLAQAEIRAAPDRRAGAERWLDGEGVGASTFVHRGLLSPEPATPAPRPSTVRHDQIAWPRRGPSPSAHDPDQCHGPPPRPVGTFGQLFGHSFGRATGPPRRPVLWP